MNIANRQVEVLADKSALIERARELIIARLEEAIATKDRFTIALSGGSTPKPLYESLARESLPWSKIHIFWGDERYVPADHPDSNQLMARQAWLDRVELPESNIHPMSTTSGDPQQDAQRYAAELKQFFGDDQIPTLDLILLGMGDDGHTASLFPQTEALQVSDRLITVGNKDGQPRLTFTVPLINQASCVMFAVAGANKQEVLEHVFAPQEDSSQYPSRLVQPQGELIWLLDDAAGAKL